MNNDDFDAWAAANYEELAAEAEFERQAENAWLVAAEYDEENQLQLERDAFYF